MSTNTIIEKLIEGFSLQGWELIGLEGSWAGALRPLEAYIENRVQCAVTAEREACADICDQHASIEGIAQRCAEQIRGRGKT